MLIEITKKLSMGKKHKLYEVELAYRKLKSYFYYDNNSLNIRKSLAEFEDDGIEDKLKSLLKLINLKKPIEDENFINLLDQIEIIVTPKSFKSKDENCKDEFILSNKLPNLPFSLENINYFIDAPIEIHILSVLWIMKEGLYLQKTYERYNYAYKISIDEDNVEVNPGLRLFDKYFEEYQKWRDRSIEQAKLLLENEQDATIVQMDIKGYFHNVKLNFDKLREEIKNNSSTKKLLFTNMLECINNKYLEKFKQKKPDFKLKNDRPPLPIGLLSSGVLGNWYLKDFDKKIMENLAPSFYGRYVDDIIVVLANTPIKRELETKKLSAFDNFIQEYFVNRDLLCNNDSIEEKSYFLKLSDKIESLEIQKKKFKILEFSHRESLAALDNFAIKLKENSSIFWMLPDDEKDSKDFDESANDLIYGDSVNKLRSLTDIMPSKFGASVFLAKRILSSLLSDESPSSKTDKQILSFFHGKYALDFYPLWEKVITYFIVNNKKDEFWEFYKTCCKSIDSIETEKSKSVLKDIKDFLFSHLKSSIAIALALKPIFLFKENTELNNKFKKYKSPVYDISKLIELVTAYRKSNLIRHNYVTLPLLNYTDYALEYNSPFLKPLLIDNEVKFLENIEEDLLEIDNETFKYSPRYVHLFETNLHSFYKFIIESTKRFKDEENVDFNKELATDVLDTSFDKFYKLNFQWQGLDEDSFKEKYKNKLYSYSNNNKYIELRIGENTPKNDKNILSVAVGNHKISKEDIEPSIKNKLIFTETKKQNLIRILNQSEEEKADVLILPEISLPFKWLKRLSAESRRKQRAFISGIEHFSIKRVCYNYIVSILPVNFGGLQESLIIPRLKNHYSPGEELLIKGIRYKVPKAKPEKYYYHLYKWNGISFTAFNCFELADVGNRDLFKAKVDVIFASEYNLDWKYFSNIAESITRDIHCYYVQSNTSNIGDSRIIQPTESNRKDILRLKGGTKSSVLVGHLDIDKLRAFQEKEYFIQREMKTFKPTPPLFDKEGVKNR